MWLGRHEKDGKECQVWRHRHGVDPFGLLHAAPVICQWQQALSSWPLRSDWSERFIKSSYSISPEQKPQGLDLHLAHALERRGGSCRFKFQSELQRATCPPGSRLSPFRLFSSRAEHARRQPSLLFPTPCPLHRLGRSNFQHSVPSICSPTLFQADQFVCAIVGKKRLNEDPCLDFFSTYPSITSSITEFYVQLGCIFGYFQPSEFVSHTAKVFLHSQTARRTRDALSRASKTIGASACA